MHIMMPDLWVQPEHADEFIEAIVSEVEHSLKVESGIIAFDLTQNHDFPNLIHVHAVYTNEAALQFHMTQQHFKDLIKLLDAWRIPPQSTTFQRSGRVLHPRPGYWEKLAADKARRMSAKPSRTTAKKKYLKPAVRLTVSKRTAKKAAPKRSVTKRR